MNPAINPMCCSPISLRLTIFPSSMDFGRQRVGPRSRDATRGELDPKLRELGVPVYFAGHDHSTWAKRQMGK